MGEVPKRDKKRDKDLIADYLSNRLTNAEISGKYKISSKRMYDILDFYHIKRKHDRETSRKST